MVPSPVFPIALQAASLTDTWNGIPPPFHLPTYSKGPLKVLPLSQSPLQLPWIFQLCKLPVSGNAELHCSLVSLKEFISLQLD